MAGTASVVAAYGAVIQWSVAQSSLGPVLIAATAKGVCLVAFGEGRDDLAARFPEAQLVEGGARLWALARQVVAVIEAPATLPAAAIPLDMAGTPFQQRVWEQLLAIPPGETRSYGAIAAALGQPGASRAVGGANGANPVAVIVPCHRVVAADGGLGGYAYGAEIKAELLRRERAS